MMIIVNSKQSLCAAKKRLDLMFEQKKHITLKVQPQQRTLTQNRAMHKFYSMLADALNDAGLDMMATLRHDASIPWQETTVKDLLWRPIQEKVVDKHSTTKLTTEQVSEVYSVLMRHLSEKFGVYVEFPGRAN